jgi:hypothetical protein
MFKRTERIGNFLADRIGPCLLISTALVDLLINSKYMLIDNILRGDITISAGLLDKMSYILR